MEMMNANKWKASFGRLCNPVKRYSLQLVARYVREVNQQHDEHRLNYGRKAMISQAWL